MQEIDMPKHKQTSGNVQGFELPRGCLMTSGLILLPIMTLAILFVAKML
jgi:hypothetical protein